jgi:hypothetical protein
MKLKERNWEQLISEQPMSGKTIEDYCASRGVNPYTFKKRKYAMGKKPKDGASEFIEIGRRVSVLNIKLKNGRILEVGSGFNDSEVQRLIRVLETC